ncbi:MAG: carboxylate--amine ligase [Firmicutes bacterium]|nr:carboxylate--amine ligase [Bacillota bacterium]
MSNQIPVVFLGANYYTGLGGIRTLGRRGVRVYALDYNFSNAYGLSSRYVYRRVLCPNINTDEEALVQFLVDFAASFPQKPVLIPSHDAYVLMVSRHSDILAQHYLFHQLPAGLLEQIIDKRGLYELAQKYQAKMPQTFFPASPEDDEEVAKNITYPCLIKPTYSHLFVKVFHKKCFVAENMKELKDALSLARNFNLEVMVQQLIPGFDDHIYLLEAFIDQNGNATHTMTAQKLRQYPANFGVSTFTRQYPVPEIVGPGIDFLQKIGYRGYCEVEYKKHAETGEYYLLEINARLSSLNVLFDACEMEFTYMIYRDLIGQPLAPKHLNNYLNLAFYHFYEDFFSVRGYRRSKQLTWKEIILPWLKLKKVYAIWAWDDPLPAFHFVKLMLGKTLSSKLHKLGSLLKTNK